MNYRFLQTIIIICWTIVFVSNAMSETPALISQQGILMDSNGNPVDGDRDVTFTIYNAPSDGEVKWQEIQTVTFDSEGLFNVLLGEINPITDFVFEDSVRWLGITIEEEPEMEPRIRIVSVPYAQRVNTIDGATGGMVIGNIGVNTEASELFALNVKGADNTSSTWSFLAQNSDGDTVLAVRNDGRVGIGTANYFPNTGHGKLVVLTEPGATNGIVLDGMGGQSFRIYGNETSMAIHLTRNGQDEKGITIEAYNGDVGIGTPTPTEKLEAAGIIYSNSGGFKFPDGTIQTTAASGGISNWSVDNSVLYTNEYWGLARGGADNKLWDGFVHTMVNFGVACTTGRSGEYHPYATVSGGYGNIAGMDHSTVGGGAGNIAFNSYATIPGGYNNRAAGHYSFAAGLRAKANHHGSFVWGDETHEDFASTGNNQFLIRAGGGVGINTNNPGAALHIGGTAGVDGIMFPDGTLQTTAASGINSNWSVDNSVLYTNEYWGLARGGADNAFIGENTHTMVNFGVACTTGFDGYPPDNYATISGGYRNVAGPQCFVGGGERNIASGERSTIGGGSDNLSDNHRGTIGGGQLNYVGGKFGFIGGGYDNVASGDSSVVAGGNQNEASGNASTIGGGDGCKAINDWSTISGGYHNYVDGKYSAILGGYADTIATGADYSYLFGVGSKLTQDSTFMVDMTHIRFGNETDGYEFPVSDGIAGQVMATDGNGQLSWADISATINNEIKDMYGLINDLIQQNVQLERRIAELEANSR